MTLEEQLILHEGLRLKPYTDTKGKLTIGIGRNLTDKGITKEEALQFLRNDIAEAKDALELHLSWSKELTPIRRRVLIDMVFNLGIGGLLKFTLALRAMREGNNDEAAQQMLKSKWARQVKGRALRLAEMMRTNEEPRP